MKSSNRQDMFIQPGAPSYHLDNYIMSIFINLEVLLANPR